MPDNSPLQLILAGGAGRDKPTNKGFADLCVIDISGADATIEALFGRGIPVSCQLI
jgi:hypothetical protein